MQLHVYYTYTFHHKVNQEFECNYKERPRATIACHASLGRIIALVLVAFCCLLNWCDDGPYWQENPRLDQLLEGGLVVPVPSSGVAYSLLQLFTRLVGIRHSAHLCK